MSQAKLGSLEICVDTAAGVAACQDHADRIELCSALSVGGLTPTPGLIKSAQASRVPVHAMIRPRIGDFDFDADVIDTCCGDILAIRQAGLAGVVLGASLNGQLNLTALRSMSDAAGPLERTLHRVIDLMDDVDCAVDQAIDLGFARILTSGGALSAIDGLERLKRMQMVANGRIEIMAGSGVAAQNVGQIAAATGIRSFHASCSRAAPQVIDDLGFAGPTRNITDPNRISAMRDAIDQMGR